MLFNSFEFFGFWLVFLAIFFSAGKKLQPVIMLVGSYIFYMGWRPWFALLLLFTTVVDFTTARLMERSQTVWGRRASLIAALSINLGILGTVKYFDFFISNIAALSRNFGYSLPYFALSLILPVGISFYTFQSIGYSLDVYNRRIAAERNFLTYAQYVSFFPQLVAGPIERAGHMLPQFRILHRLQWDNVVAGLWLIGYGLFKKMCVADSVSPVVAAAYNRPDSYSGAYEIVATILFSLQIYCDFSGYSDIARGVARVMGFELMVNFRQPYFSTSLTDFWRSWHISLSSWFRDYLYIPLGGSRGGNAKVERNLMIVFVISGLWHGASWTFICWGALHGIGLVVERGLGRMTRIRSLARGPLTPFIGWLWTAVFVLVGWVFFRARSISDAFRILESFAHPGTLSYYTFKELRFSSFDIITLISSILILLVVDYVIMFKPAALARFSSRSAIATATGVSLTYYILLFGVFGRLDFIYFQF